VTTDNVTIIKENANVLSWNVCHVEITFDHDYRHKHEIKIHVGNHVRVKDFSLGKAGNPFSAGQLNPQRKILVLIIINYFKT